MHHRPPSLKCDSDPLILNLPPDMDMEEHIYTPDDGISPYMTPSPLRELLDSQDAFPETTVASTNPFADHVRPEDLEGCSHQLGQDGFCRECNQFRSPPRQRPKSLQRAFQPRVGTGHGQKVSGWCSSRDEPEVNQVGVTPGVDSMEQGDDDVDPEFKTSRMRKDRKVAELPPMREIRSKVYTPTTWQKPSLMCVTDALAE